MPDIAGGVAALFAYAPVVLQGVMAVVTAASAVTALTPTPKDDQWVGQLYRVLEVLALNIGHATARR